MPSPLSATLKVLRCSPSNPDNAISEEMIAAPSEGERMSALARYIVTRDEGLLVFNEGIAPTWFHLRRLPLMWIAAALDQVYPRSAQRLLAFRAGCHLIEGAGDPLSVAAPGERGAFVAKKADYGVTLAPEAWVQEIGDVYGAEVVQEMGELIITHSRLPRGARGPFGSWAGTAASP